MKDDLIEMMCWECESGSGRKWEELRFRELNFRSLESEMPTGHLSKLQKAHQCQSKAQEEDLAGLALHLMLAKKIFLPNNGASFIHFLKLGVHLGPHQGSSPIKAKRSQSC